MLVDEVLSDWVALGQAGDHRVDRDALQKGLGWMYSLVGLQPPSFIGVLDSPLGAQMAAELLEARACGREPRSGWAEVHWEEAVDDCPGYPDMGGHMVWHLSPLAPAVIETVMQRTERQLVAQGGGGDWSAVIGRLTERLSEITEYHGCRRKLPRPGATPRRDRQLGEHSVRTTPLGHRGTDLGCTHVDGGLSSLHTRIVHSKAGAKCNQRIQRHFEGVLAAWSRGADMDSRGLLWAVLQKGGEPVQCNHDPRFLGLGGKYEADDAAAYDFLVRSGVVSDPFVSNWLDLLKLGFWDILALETCAFAVRRPLSALRDQQGRLHCAVGPAVAWADGWANYYLQGVSVSEQVLCPDSLTLNQVLDEPNLEVRRIMVEQMGWARFVSSGQLMDSDTDGSGLPRRLFHLDDPTGGEEPVRLVQLVCPSTQREYFLRVPPETRTCGEAVAWTFGLEPSNYHPAVET